MAEFPIRAGHETAEIAGNRPLLRQNLGHSLETARPVHQWFKRDYGASKPYALHAYLGRYRLPEPIRVVSVEIQKTGPGRIVIRDLFLKQP